MMVSPSPGSSRASPVSSMSPTTELCRRLVAVRCSRTLCWAHLRGERVAAGGQLADQVGERLVERVASGLGAQRADGAVGDLVPVEEEAVGAAVEEHEAGQVERRPSGSRMPSYRARHRSLAARMSARALRT